MFRIRILGVMLILLLVGTLPLAFGLQEMRAEADTVSDYSMIRYTNEVSGGVIDLIGGAENDGYGSGYPDPFPAPWDGQGANRWMDVVFSQSYVALYALVAYDDLPVQNESVDFKITGPYDKLSNGTFVLGQRFQIWFKSVAVTNDTGIAKFVCRMPWPCDDPDGIMGIWKASAVASLCNETIADEMMFYYERAVYIVNVTTDDVCYTYESYVGLNVEYRTHAMQTYPAFFSVVITDCDGVPFGMALKNGTIGGTTFCTWKTATFHVSIFIPKWARSGYGQVHVNCYDKEPSDGGFAWCQECDPTPEILISYNFVLLGDINSDGKVDVKDLYFVAKAYGSFLGNPQWNPKCDINNDYAVNSKDYYIVCKNYGKTAS